MIDIHKHNSMEANSKHIKYLIKQHKISFSSGCLVAFLITCSLKMNYRTYYDYWSSPPRALWYDGPLWVAPVGVCTSAPTDICTHALDTWTRLFYGIEYTRRNVIIPNNQSTTKTTIDLTCRNFICQIISNCNNINLWH